MRKKANIQLDSMEDNPIDLQRVTEDEFQTLRAIVGEKRSAKIEVAFKLYLEAHKNYYDYQPSSSPINPQPINTSKIPECKLALEKLIKVLEPI